MTRQIQVIQAVQPTDKSAQIRPAEVKPKPKRRPPVAQLETGNSIDSEPAALMGSTAENMTSVKEDESSPTLVPGQATQTYPPQDETQALLTHEHNAQAPETTGSFQMKVAIPGSKRLLYDLHGNYKGNDYFADGLLLWQHDGAKYESEFQVKAFLLGSRSQTSKGRIGESGLIPERFGDKTRREQAAHFDWDNRKVIFSANTPSAELLEGAQDRVSVMVQLAAMLAADPARYPAGLAFSLQTVSVKESEMWNLSVEAHETLDTGRDKMDTIRIMRHPRRPFDPTVEVWFAPALDFLPARIRITNSNGDYLNLTLDKVAPL